MYKQRNKALCISEPLLTLNLNLDVSVIMDLTNEKKIVQKYKFISNINLVGCHIAFSEHPNNTGKESEIFHKYKHVYLFH